MKTKPSRFILRLVKPKVCPGSEKAIAVGCSCPVMDNLRGRGIGVTRDGSVMFWVDAGCKIHEKDASGK